MFFAVFFNAFQGAREVDKVLVDNARILGASRWDLMRTIILPSATSWILASMHVAFGFALIGAIVGEFTGADKGLGILINRSQGNFDAAGIYAGMLITTVLALGAEWLITKLEDRLTSWRPPSTSQTAAGALTPTRPARTARDPDQGEAMHRNAKRLAAAALALTTATSLAACRSSSSGGASGDSAGGTPKVSIMVGGIDKVIYLPAMLTERLGYFKDAGVDVELLDRAVGASAENVLVAGKVQGVVGFYDHTITLQAQGKCIESVVQLAKVPGEAEVVSTTSAHSRKVRRTSPARSSA